MDLDDLEKDIGIRLVDARTPRITIRRLAAGWLIAHPSASQGLCKRSVVGASGNTVARFCVISSRKEGAPMRKMCRIFSFFCWGSAA